MRNADSRTAGVLFAGASFTETSIGPEMMEQVTGDLGVAFYTTLLASCNPPC